MEAFMKRLSMLLVALVVVAPAFAQETLPAPGVGMVKTMQSSFNYVKDLIIRSAEQMPEADYAFKATPEVRSFGQLVGHVADANYFICSTVLGEANPSPGVEKSKTSKADLTAALKGSYEYCGKAYAIPDAKTGTKIKLFGQENTRLSGLLVDLTHNWEHYGNIVTYLRLKGQVPPSSQMKP
jgi:uncharacterized damage-inducible protein DinB